jgi:probable F420-dependent oxidoreductase
VSVDGLRFGVVFPHGNAGFGRGRDASRRFCEAIEDAGFDYLAVPDHVVGADTTHRPHWPNRAAIDDPYREVFVHLGFLAGQTRLELVPCVLVLPQRQAVLAAKQAAELDILSGGRLRLGVGAGWNEVESRALGADFGNRGARFDEQLQVMKLLWTAPVVSFHGRFHDLDDVGIAPPPHQRPIPLWIGGGPSRVSPHPLAQVYTRIAAFGDGWIASPTLTEPAIATAYATISRRAEDLGRDPATIGVQATIRVAAAATVDSERDAILRRLATMRELGVTHVTFDARAGALTIPAYADVLGRLREITVLG